MVVKVLEVEEVQVAMLKNPFMALVRKDTTEQHGEVYGFSLIYSGNFLANVEVDMYENARAQIGINPFDFTWLLKSKEEFTAPEAVLVYSNEGLTGMSHIYNCLYGKRLCKGKYRDEVRPILINNWEATYFDLMKQNKRNCEGSYKPRNGIVCIR